MDGGAHIGNSFSIGYVYWIEMVHFFIGRFIYAYELNF